MLEETESTIGDDCLFLMTVEDLTTYCKDLEGADCFVKLPKGCNALDI